MADKLAVIQSEESIKEIEAIDRKTNELIATFNELVKVSDKINSGLLSGKPKDFVTSNAEMIKQQKEMIRLEKEIEQLNQQKLRTEQQLERNRQSKANADNAEIRLSQQKEKQLAREQAKLQSAESLYKRVEAKLKDITQRYNELAVKKELGIKLTEREELSLTRLTAKQQKYDATLKAVDATAGKYNRNVGNYASGFNSMNNAINQLTREAPAFTVSMQTGFLALSNNWATLSDAISQARLQNEQLIASGQKGIPIWKQITSALFSWQTALSVGITLLTIYGDDMVKWLQTVVKGRNSINELAISMKDLNEIKKESNKESAKEIANSRVLYSTIKNEALPREQRLKAAKAMQELYPKIFGNMTTEQMLITDMTGKYNQLTGAIRANALAKALNNKLAEKAEQLLNDEQEAIQKIAKEMEFVNKTRAGKGVDPLYATREEQTKASQERIDLYTKEYMEKRKAYNKYADDIEKRIQKSSAIGDLATPNKGATSVKSGSNTLSVTDSAEERERKRLAELKRLYEEEFKVNKSHYDKLRTLSDIASKQLEESDWLTNVDRLTKQIEIDNNLVDSTKRYYDKQIETAKKYSQTTLDLENNRDEEIAKIQLNRLRRQQDLPNAFKTDIESANKVSANMDEATYQASKGNISRNRELTDRQRSLELDRLEISYLVSKLEKQKLINATRLNELQLKAQSGRLTQKEAEEMSSLGVELTKINNELQEAEKNLYGLDFQYMTDALSPLVDIVRNGLNDLGLDNIANQFTSLYDKLIKEGLNFKMTNEDIFKSAMAIIVDFSNQLVENQKKRTIQALDEQLKYSQNKTEQEVGFIEGRLEYLNNLQDATDEQIIERNRLEDEARALREQQEMREKMIAKQKAKALQQAQAQQTLINGAQGAVMAYLSQLIPGDPTSVARGLAVAGSTMAFSTLMAGLIMAKNPVPQYYVGRDGGKAEWAYTQEKGAEIITDKKGNIKSFGSDGGAKMTWLDEGDKVYTAEETRKILQNMDNAEIGTNLFKKIAREGNAMPIFVNNQIDNSEKIIKGVGSEFERVIRKYDKTNAYRNENGDLVIERGNRIPEVRRVKKEKINITIQKPNVRD